MSQFNRVTLFTQISGQTTNIVPQLDIFTTSPKILAFRLSLVEEECNELKEAIIAKDFIEVIDALADIAYVVHGFSTAIGAIPLDHNISQYDKIAKYMLLNGHTVNKTPQLDIFNDNADIVDVRFNFIDQYLKTLKNGILKENFTEITTSLSNIIYGVNRFAIDIGINLDDAFNIVSDSNMSKFCSNENEAINTVEWYVLNESRYDSPSYKKSLVGNMWVVYNKSTGKTLKNIKYVPADFASLINI